MLAGILFFAGTVSLVLLFAAIELTGSTAGRVVAIRRWLTVYSLLVTLAACTGILWFLGFRRGGSPAFRESSRATLDWLGYYDAAGMPLRFSADGGNTTLKLTRLGPDDAIALTPTARPPQNDSIDWRLSATVSSQPLRVNGIVANISAKNWLLDRDVVVIEEIGGGSFFTLEFIDERQLLRPIYAVRYNQGALAPDGTRLYDLTRPVEIWSTPIASDRTLAAMLRSLDRHRKAPRPPSGWSFKRRPDFDELLRQGVTRDAFFGRLGGLKELAKDAIWVREESDHDSRTALMIADPMGWAKIWRIVRTSRDGSSYSMLDPAPPINRKLEDGTEIELGTGSATSKQRFALPTRWSRDRIIGSVADVLIRNQPRWELPPNAHEPFVIMSSEADVPMSGYNLDIGLLRQPFYAKAQMNGDGMFVVNDGRDHRAAPDGPGAPTVAPGDTFRLGASHTGAVLTFRLAASPVPFAGIWCLAIVLALCAMFAATMRTAHIIDPVAETAWAVLLHVVIFILLTRVILTYRIAVLPPADASAPMRMLFNGSLVYSVVGLFAIPLLMLIVRRLSRGRLADAVQDFLARRHSIRSLDFPIGVLLSIGLFIAWFFIVVFTGAKENVGPIRVNVATQVLSLIALALSAEWMSSLSSWRRAAALAVWIAVPMLLMVVIVGDHGFLINGMAMVIVALAVLLWDRYRKLAWFEWAAVMALAVALVAVVLLRERILIGITSDSFVERVASPKESYVYYRIAATSAGRERLLEKVGDPDDFRFDMYRRNAAHHWQMLLYASEGASRAKRYGEARLSRVGMSYPTSLSDSMFAIYLLPEHGLAGGVALLFLYLVGAIAVLVIAGSLPDSFRWRAFALIAVACHLVFTTLYMASTNLGQFVFTGQNIPMLSLASRSDLFAAGVLLAIVTALAHTATNTQAPRLFGSARWLKRISVAAVAAAAVWILLVAVSIHSLGTDEQLRKPLRFPPAVLKTYREHLPGASPNPQIVLRRNRLTAVGPVSWIEQKFIEQFNESPDRYDRDAGFFYLARTPMGDSIRINERYFSIPSPFHPLRRWDGIIRYGAKSYPTLNVLGSDVQIHPGRVAESESISLTAPPNASHEYSNDVLLKLKDSGPSLCELKLENGKAYIYPLRTRMPGAADWETRVDGEPAKFEQELKGGEIIRIDGRTAQRGQLRPFSYSLLYLGNYEPVLAATRWRNGERQRIVHAGTLDSVVSDIGAALDTEIAEADDAEEATARLPRAVSLTFDMPLQNELDRYLAVAAPPIYDAVPGQRREVVAVSIVDAFDGDVLAMASWQPPQPRPERNWNIRNHAIGSTIKPILLSTIATGYEGSGFDVTEFSAEDRSDCAAPQGSTAIHPHCSVAGVALEPPLWDCDKSTARTELDTRTFLVESRNFMAVTLGMLGMIDDPHEWKSFLMPYDTHAISRAAYHGVPYTLSLGGSSTVAFTMRDPLPSPLPNRATHSVLFTTMPTLFHVSLPRSMNAAQIDEERKQDLASYLRSLPLTVGRNYYVDDILPDRIDLLPQDLQSIRRDLLPFFLGGGREGLWSSVRMSEAIARVATGLKMNVHLDYASTPAVSPVMPSPLSNSVWRERNILEPLSLVGRTSPSLPGIGALSSTAAGLAETIDHATPKGKHYRALFKTGTLDERDTGHFESEMLMFVIGEWENNAFVRGRTISGYLYMADTKIKSVRQWQRGDLAEPMLQMLVQFLAQRPLPTQVSAPRQTESTKR